MVVLASVEAQWVVPSPVVPFDVVPKPGGAAGCGCTCSRPGGGRRGSALVVVPGGS